MTTKTVRTPGPRTPIPHVDENGTACLRVPLDDRGQNFALIEQNDYNRIVQTTGCQAKWCLASNGRGRRYVVVNPPRVKGRAHGLISVGRLVAETAPGQTVRYATSDTLDLRRPNLTIKKGGGRSRRNCGKRLAENVKASKKAKAERQTRSFPQSEGDPA